VAYIVQPCYLSPYTMLLRFSTVNNSKCSSLSLSAGFYAEGRRCHWAVLSGVLALNPITVLCNRGSTSETQQGLEFGW